VSISFQSRSFLETEGGSFVLVTLPSPPSSRSLFFPSAFPSTNYMSPCDDWLPQVGRTSESLVPLPITSSPQLKRFLVFRYVAYSPPVLSAGVDPCPPPPLCVKAQLPPFFRLGGVCCGLGCCQIEQLDSSPSWRAPLPLSTKLWSIRDLVVSRTSHSGT